MAKKEDIGMMKRQVQMLNEKLHDLQDQTGEYISENPFKSTAVAFGVGLVAGAILLKLLEKR